MLGPPAGKPSAEQLARIRTRKPAPPVLEVTLADGSKVPLWNTFAEQQVNCWGPGGVTPSQNGSAL